MQRRPRRNDSPGAILISLISLLAVSQPGIKYLMRMRKKAASIKWPQVAGTFESAQVDSRQAGRYHQVTRYLLKVRFSYVALGATYFGNYSEEFTTSASAEQMRRSLENGPLFVRWNPAKPKDYFVDPYRDVQAT